MQIAVEGGTLRFSKAAGSLDAHCCHHGASCKTDRTLTQEGDTRGRPLGRHLLWLSMGEGLSPEGHKGILKSVGQQAYHGLRLNLRSDFTLEARTNRDMKAVLEAERQRLSPKDVGSEPLVSP